MQSNSEATTRKETAWFLSLPPHMAYLLVCGDITIIPCEESPGEGLPNRLIIHSSEYADADERKEGDNFFLNIDLSPEHVPNNCVIGWVETKKVYQYDDEKWAKDAEKHGYESPLHVFKMTQGWSSAWALETRKGHLLHDYIFDVVTPDAANGLLWNGDNPFYEMVSAMALGSGSDLVADLTATEAEAEI